MTASADKLQHILQNCLEESINLVKRGVFTQQELQSIMLRRQKCQHAMLKTTYQMTDYLGSIEYEYQLERERRKRMQDLSKLEEGTNPLFRKQSSADYAIVKRIIRLWDRTMHKYKFQLKLWKQYLSFTLAISSKKHFYKALTNAIRFLPYQVDLWKIGAAYEMERGMNMWKGRKLLIKGIKMVPSGQKNLFLTEFMLGYEIQFLRRLVERKNILIKGEAPLKLIGTDENEHLSGSEQEKQQEPQILNIQEYNQVLWVILEETISKNCNNRQKELSFESIKNRLLNYLRKAFEEEENGEVKQILKKVVEQLKLLEGKEIENKDKKAKELKCYHF